jgi:hypothetical protein
VPDAGTKTIANGDLVAFVVQMVTRGGADSVTVQRESINTNSASLPFVTTFLGGAYADAVALPNAVITFSDGARGYFFGGYVATTGSATVNANSGTSLKEAGNLLQFPFPVRAYGIYGAWSIPVDASVALYSDPLGTPVAEKTISYDANAISATSSANQFFGLFPAPYDIPANTPVVVAVKGGATNTAMLYKTFNAALHQESEPLGQNCYAVTRNAAAFAAQNSSKDRATIGLLIGAFDGGGGGGLASPMHGMAVS